MRDAALALAFFGVAVSPFEGLFYSYGVPEVLPYPHLSLCLPALLFGLVDLSVVGRQFLSLPLVACVVLSAASLGWVDDTERGRGLLVFAGLATSLPIAATIVRHGSHRLSAQAFIFGTLVLFALALTRYTPGARLGYFAVYGHGVVSDPNEFGGQMVAAAMLAASFFVVGRSDWRRGAQGVSVSGMVAVTAIGALVTATLLSASRGALACLVMTCLAFFARTGTAGGRVTATLAAGIVLMGLAPFAYGLIEPAASRLADFENVGSLGSRLEIWLAAWDGRDEIGWMGVGVGGVEKQIAAHATYEAAVLGIDGVTRLASHNGFVEWVVSLGIPGMAVGTWLAMQLYRTAIVFDGFDRRAHRLAFLAYVATLSMSLPPYRLTYWTPLAALAFAMFAAPGATQEAAAAAQCASPKRAGQDLRRSRLPTPRAGRMSGSRGQTLTRRPEAC